MYNGHYLYLEIQKTRINLAKDKELEVIGRWRKACLRHFYWAATSTHSGIGEVEWAQFESFFSHVTNVHKGLPNKIFNKCAYSDVVEPVVVEQTGILCGPD